jgi:hypothetical protein
MNRYVQTDELFIQNEDQINIHNKKKPEIKIMQEKNK